MFSSNSSSLQLIDFGRSIDLKLLPAGATFNKVVKTDGIMCTEMKEGRPWRHHIDYYGLAAISYCLLFGSYLDTVKVRLPHGYLVNDPIIISIGWFPLRGEGKLQAMVATGVMEGVFLRIYQHFGRGRGKASVSQFSICTNAVQEHLPNISGWKSRFEETFFREKMAKSLHRLKSDVMKAMLS